MESNLNTLITDRTADDVSRVVALTAKGLRNMTAEERSEWLLGMKGAYNASDLNRVGYAMLYVSERLSEVGIVTPFIAQPKTDWVVTDIPRPLDMQHYVYNAQIIHDALGRVESLPDVPSDMNNLTYQEANDIEQLLLDVNHMIDLIRLSFVYSGQTYSGVVWSQIGG